VGLKPHYYGKTKQIRFLAAKSQCQPKAGTPDRNGKFMADWRLLFERVTVRAFVTHGKSSRGFVTP